MEQRREQRATGASRRQRSIVAGQRVAFRIFRIMQWCSSSNTPRTSASSSGKRQESVLWIADNKERAADRGPWGRPYRLTSQLVSAHKNCGTPVCRVCSTGCGFICYVGVGGCGRGRLGASDQHGARISDCSIPRIRTRTRTRRSQYSTVQYFLISFFSHFSSFDRPRTL